MIRKLILGTVISILVFLSISFVTVLLQINSPLNRQTNNHLDIGFPLTYYSQFIVDVIPNSGWSGRNLLLDVLFTWVATTGAYLLLFKKKKA